MIVITGSMGQLGSDIEKVCQKRSIPYLGIDREDLNITDRDAVNDFFESHSFETLIHCAAYTAVDLAEDEIESCISVNTKAVEYISDACKKHNVKLIFISTDYVFDGLKDGLYETSDMTSALSIYGQSKAIAEKYIEDTLSKYFIVRISWAFGINGKNFVRT
ncbi:MAG: sugar nucleotide-binding protein, partial [Ignavibacteria bacterium]|nr:sugar nucleotide-binding protein [Ignavibacteria bacterium]